MVIFKTNADDLIFENKMLDVENVGPKSILKAFHMKSILPIYVRCLDCIFGSQAKHIFPQISNHNEFDTSCAKYNTYRYLFLLLLMFVYSTRIMSNDDIYTLTVTCIGDYGYADHDGEVIRNESHDYTVRYGDSFSITAIPDEGYRVVKIRNYKENWGWSVSEYADTSSESHYYSTSGIK